MRILFCKIGWMDFYDGQTKSDVITGGGSYIQEHGVGSEIFNFSECGNQYYGFVRASISGDAKINRLGAKIDDEYIDNILIIWLATHPKQGGFRIAGWYKNARIYRYVKKAPIKSKRSKEGFVYNIESTVEESYLIPSDERTFIVPKGSKTSGGIGQSNVFYCEGAKNEKLKLDVINYVSSYRKLDSEVNRKGKTKRDVAHNKKVENSAIDAATKYYTKLGYKVISVESENTGWDLEASIRNETLLIEVKGTASEKIEISLTPNEYKKMEEYKSSYRLFIHTDALDKLNCNNYIFSYDSDSGLWKDYEKNILDFEEIISAKVKIYDVL